MRSGQPHEGKWFSAYLLDHSNIDRCSRTRSVYGGVRHVDRVKQKPAEVVVALSEEKDYKEER